MELNTEQSEPISPQLKTPSLWQRLGFFRNIISAIPLLLLASAYVFPSLWIVKWAVIAPNQLAKLIHLEAVAIGSFPLLFIFGSIKRPDKNNPAKRDRVTEIFRAILFLGTLFVFCYMAFDIGGWWGLLVFGSLNFVTYMGFFLRITEPQIIAQLIVRFFINYAVFILLAIIWRMPESMNDWMSHKNIYNLGANYFLFLGIIEASGFYQAQWIKDLNIIEKIRREK